MFKEAFVTMLCLIGIYVVFRILIRKNEPLAKKFITGGLLLTLILNIGYNGYAFFPRLVLDDKNYLGDAEENLFIYNAPSEFRDQIIFPVLQNRAVLVDESAGFYTLFLSTFSKNVTELSLAPVDRDSLISARDRLSFSTEFSMVNLANYAFPEYIEISEVPDLYLDEDSLSDEDTLIAVSDESGNLYLFTQSTYREVTGHE